MSNQPSAVQLADLDQKFAAYNKGLDQLVEMADRYVAEDGAELATSSIAHNFRHAAETSGVERIFGIAAVALVRLAQQKRADRAAHDASGGEQ